jgi:hypothetical protein
MARTPEGNILPVRERPECSAESADLSMQFAVTAEQSIVPEAGRTRLPNRIKP